MGTTGLDVSEFVEKKGLSKFVEMLNEQDESARRILEGDYSEITRYVTEQHGKVGHFQLELKLIELGFKEMSAVRIISVLVSKKILCCSENRYYSLSKAA